MRAVSQGFTPASALRRRSSQQPWMSARRAKSNGMLGVVQSSISKRCSSSARSSLKRRKLLERSEEHTSELQSLMRTSYAVFCLKKTKTKHTNKVHRQMHDRVI